jgi:YHS domain-containing protein
MHVARLLAVILFAGFLSACGSMNVVSDGADARLMLRGNDPVSYFTQARPAQGRADIKADYDGVTYRFATDENRKLFVASPAKYAPQFGGFCSNGMAYAVPIAGETDNYKVIDGKLYMFGGYRSKLFFEMDQEKNLKLAQYYWDTEVKDANWRVQSWKRVFFSKVPHYKTNAELAAEYEQRTGKKL